MRNSFGPSPQRAELLLGAAIASLLGLSLACSGGGPSGDAGLSSSGDASGDVDSSHDSGRTETMQDADEGEQRVILVIIDGARYTESLGDEEIRFVPEMAALAEEGCAPGPILNTGLTVTIAGTSVIHTGVYDAWREDPITGEVYQAFPTHWEYTRKQLSLAADEAYFVLKYISDDSLWKPSRHRSYGPEYWPTFLSEGETDEDVFGNLARLFEEQAPTLTVLYLADVDAAGHSGSWERYTSAVSTADSIVGRLWELVQSSPELAGNTTMIVTSDHGRHDDEHGGFTDHGDGCDGCRQVTFLAIGPNVDPDCAPADPPRTLADIAPTIGRILGYEATYSEGEPMEGIFLR